MPPALFLLALTAADQPMLLYMIIGGLMALGPVVRSYIFIWDWFKGKSIDPSDFVTHRQLATIKAERDAQLASSVGEIKADVERMEKTLADMARDFADIHRSLGRVEGHDAAGLQRPRRPR